MEWSDWLHTHTPSSLLPPPSTLKGACFSQVRNTKKSAGRLKETLVDAGLGLPLALLIGQQRDRIVFEDGSNKHVKLVGMLYDYVSGRDGEEWSEGGRREGDGWEEGGEAGGDI